MWRTFFIIGSVLFVAALAGCKRSTARIIADLGYTYDAKQDIYVSRVDAWQRKAGYSGLVDSVAVPAGMVIDCEPVIFDYNGKTYMIEFWKGQYDLSAGAEIGIYIKSNSEMWTWKCVDNQDMLHMSYVLKKNGQEVFNRSGRHWWLTGFKPGGFANPRDLTMDVAIVFDSRPGMLDPFSEGLRKLGYHPDDVRISGDTVSLLFDRPKSGQPVTDSAFIALTQKKNKEMVDAYNGVKKELNLPDNSPGSIEKMLVRTPDLLEHFLKSR
jgi:hypothetical protein